jgi:hypothetical protein
VDEDINKSFHKSMKKMPPYDFLLLSFNLNEKLRRQIHVIVTGHTVPTLPVSVAAVPYSPGDPYAGNEQTVS